MNLTTYITVNKEVISARLSEFITEKREFFKDETPTLDALDRIERFAKRGKMLRGILVLLSFELFTKKEISPAVLDLAVAMELTQSGALIHDDIMDNDLVRRGEKTLFAQYIDEGQEASLSSPEFYGQGMGMCIGDLSFYLAFELIGRAELNSKITQTYALLFQRCISGQVFDFVLGQTNKEGTKEEIIQMYLNKTGSYSVVLPLLLGAYAADAPTSIIPSLEEIGKLIGIIFQIKDDELGLLGTTQEIGKPQGSDIRENKKTLVRFLLYKNATPADKLILDSVFGQKKNAESIVTTVHHLYKKYSIETQIEEIIKTFSQSLPSHFEKLPETQSKKLLQEFYLYNMSRKV